MSQSRTARVLEHPLWQSKICGHEFGSRRRAYFKPNVCRSKGSLVVEGRVRDDDVTSLARFAAVVCFLLAKSLFRLDRSIVGRSSSDKPQGPYEFSFRLASRGEAANNHESGGSHVQ